MSDKGQSNGSDESFEVYEPGRRDFLKVSGAAAAVVMFGVSCARQVTQGTFPIEEASALTVGSARLVEAGPFIIARDEDGLYAMSALCTHMGCTLTVDGERLPCPCHGSVFDANGQVVHGPARAPLDHYSVTVDGGAVSVDTTQVVPASTRVAAEG